MMIDDDFASPFTPDFLCFRISSKLLRCASYLLTLFSLFGYPDITLSLVFNILLKGSNAVICNHINVHVR